MKTTTAARYRQTAVTCVLLMTLQPLPVSLGVKSEINYELNEIRNITDFFLIFFILLHLLFLKDQAGFVCMCCFYD